jgi:hypothetical protein
MGKNKAFPLKSGMRQGVYSLLLIQYNAWVLTAIRQEKEDTNRKSSNLY